MKQASGPNATSGQPDVPAATEQDENRLIAERRAKLDALRARGEAYPNDFRKNATAAQLQSRFGELDHATLEAVGEEFAVAGRMMAQRLMGKIAFVRLQDRSGEIQLVVQRDHLPEGIFQEFKHWDVGDIIAGTGHMFRTQKGELSLKLNSLRLLAKSLRPLPEKWHGLTDTELRYRQRYVDLIVNPASQEVFRRRSRIISFIRAFMEAPGREFLEVETPMMHPIPGGAAARPFKTHHNALDLDMYLRIAPELYLKRLIVGGLGRVYEINRNFRNEGVSTRHNPEFTMLEFYWAYADYNDLIDLTEQMFRGLAMHMNGSLSINYQGEAIDFAPPFERLSVEAAVRRYDTELASADLWDEGTVRAVCKRHGIHIEKSWGPGRMLMELFDVVAEPHLRGPVFITSYPTEVSPLSRRNDVNPLITDRFELFIAGREIANGFSELNDPEDQAQRFLDQVASMDAGDLEAMHYDADYVRALEYGMPPTAGEGIGIDRLVMLYTDSASIRDVLLFPHMRPESRTMPAGEQQKLDLDVLMVQARLAWKNPAENRAHLEELLDAELTADKPHVDLAIFPETFTTGFLGDPNVPPEDMDGPTVGWLREIARRFNTALAGSAVIVEKGQRFNRFMLVTPDGVVQQYDKRHLFAYGGENQRYVSGKVRTVVKLGDWRICPQVCYDLRFPVWCRQRGDYDLLLFVANWPGSRIEHWMALLQARAIENQAWVIGLNRVGKDGNGVDYPGRSQVYDPGGKKIVDLESREISWRLQLQRDKVAEVQKTFPFQADADAFEWSARF